MRILLVEDERAIADFIQRGLHAEGYIVTWAADGDHGAKLALSEEFDLIVLDLMLPGRDGLAVLTDIRSAGVGAPVIVLTARGEVEDRVAGLDGGATDYIVKPFSFDELAARIRVHLRPQPRHSSTELEAAGVKVDLLTREVEYLGGAVRLSAKEFDLLAHFLHHPNQVLTREQILSAVWGYAFDPATNVVEVYVGYLRRKLASESRPAPIETVRSVGYRLRARG
jgi:DNA-binding response OmpR family regulator